MIAAGIRAAQSAPVTEWGTRILLTLGVLLVIALAVWGMRHGWRARATRQADLPAPPARSCFPSARNTLMLRCACCTPLQR